MRQRDSFHRVHMSSPVNMSMIWCFVTALLLWSDCTCCEIYKFQLSSLHTISTSPPSPVLICDTGKLNATFVVAVTRSDGSLALGEQKGQLENCFYFMTVIYSMLVPSLSFLHHHLAQPKAEFRLATNIHSDSGSTSIWKSNKIPCFDKDRRLYGKFRNDTYDFNICLRHHSPLTAPFHTCAYYCPKYAWHKLNH